MNEQETQKLLNALEVREGERRLLDAALAEYEKDQDWGRPWREVLRELRTRWR